ncbi:methylated-DNA--[protein]-cysteine S-methyltransferase [Pseudoalteromonas sp. SR44-5]|uniref:bifunctional transcriptional activator/DNA repair enzyme AdaA n=1 Tax=Pseudoalteromonas TaxID=53246 RepID=UPI001602F933|nr:MULTISPECIES: methylated-DNA--[protein]-cysteine S-methyltransferase [unclassified Pseudoalteromonas]MBB1343348.1 methylated-DNA--[protein]-cysteine S-methyltransferase [Pseudoalteromonas sp. SR45-6]MBB1367904.1 methylated-DNA--[protein]-cysteine S-methyltransferase [Pseudoalteromonas sp. SR44-5]MBB1418942.1 methylated-DNA--[protein]-cysteine S-methyltransferase [Pseudoalteromonas sp. SG44-1]MBB1435069.1 methylated-DNA--[protein]-cysteine S-methyltransferase [Pseudoalteromonas sp. SG43-6]MB
MSDYDRIARAMAYLVDRATTQPALEEIAAHVHLSPYHFQRLFCRWAGTTPKRFLQVLTLERSKELLDKSRSLLDVSHEIGLSGSSRLHDHFVQLEAVTPGEYKNKGKELRIEYGVHPTPLGPMFVAVTQRGVCRVEFMDFNYIEELLDDLRNAWPLSSIVESITSTHYVIDAFFSSDTAAKHGPLSLHVKGTNFQVAVWRALLKIPPGAVASYSQVATALNAPQSARAVGNAIGANPVALLIPCHRVIQHSGALGGYRWGPAKKLMVQTWEKMRDEPVSL